MFAQEPIFMATFIANTAPNDTVVSFLLSLHTNAFIFYGYYGELYTYNNKQCVCTHLIRSGRRSTSFGCVCFIDLEGDKATVQHSISSVDSSTGCEGVFSSAI